MARANPQFYNESEFGGREGSFVQSDVYQASGGPLQPVPRLKNTRVKAADEERRGERTDGERRGGGQHDSKTHQHKNQRTNARGNKRPAHEKAAHAYRGRNSAEVPAHAAMARNLGNAAPVSGGDVSRAQVSANSQSVENARAVRAQTAGKRKFYDYNLLTTVIFIFAIGLLIIYSSSQYVALQDRGDASYYFMRQLRIGSVGIAAAVLLSFFDYKILKSFLAKAGYFLACGLLGLTMVSGIAGGGKMRWLEVAGQTFQPTEAAKLLIIVWAASYISIKGTAMNKRENIIRLILFSLLPVGMIVTNNISSAVIVVMIVAVMLFVCTTDYKIYAGLLAMAGLSVAALRVVLYNYIIDNNITERPSQYWLRRIYAWVAPEIFETDAYQTVQGIYAIGSGGLTGQGLGDSIQKYGTIPEVQNDMIFTVFCEEFGFIGAATLVILYIFLLYRIYVIARNARDLFGTMICTGVMAHIGVQVAFNLAVVTGVMPNTGVTLPFISYGGSAVLFTMIEMGLVLSVAHRIEV